MAQCFSGIQLRRPHIASAITNQGLIIGFAIGTNAAGGHPFVVNAHLLSRLDVVVENHLAGAGDQSAANLYRRQPVKMKMRNKVVRKMEQQVGDVFDPRLYMTTADRAQSVRLAFDQIIHD